MVGPNPYKPYSYAEALHFEPGYVVCYECRRYAFISKARHGDRDTRTTTWSCCVCGGGGHATYSKPGDHIREDTRQDPRHHPKAIARLTRKPFRPSRAVQLRETPKDRRRARG